MTDLEHVPGINQPAHRTGPFVLVTAAREDLQIAREVRLVLGV